MLLITIYEYQNKLTIEPLKEVTNEQLNLIENTYSVRLKDKKEYYFLEIGKISNCYLQLKLHICILRL